MLFNFLVLSVDSPWYYHLIVLSVLSTRLAKQLAPIPINQSINQSSQIKSNRIEPKRIRNQVKHFNQSILLQNRSILTLRDDTYVYLSYLSNLT